MHQLNIEELPFEPSGAVIIRQLINLDCPVWLDSGKPSAQLSRFDIFTAEPIEKLVNPTAADIENVHRALCQLNQKSQALLESLDIPFVAGVIGFFDYESNHDQHGMPKPPVYSQVLAVDQVIVTDHRACKSFFCSLRADYKSTNLYKVAKALCNHQDVDTPEPLDDSTMYSAPIELSCDHTETRFVEAVHAIHDYIRAGDAYQINYSQEFQAPIAGDHLELYLACREKLAAPYGCFASLGERTILSYSPERLVSAKGIDVKTQPIKGTIRRGNDAEEDRELAQILKNSTKDQAENVMIVDLLRNDFSKSCEPFSVKVTKLFELKSFQNVHHLVSTIVGKLRLDRTIWQFFFDCFPGGSITGAPKRRAMEIIDELEVRKRGIYCGSIAYHSISEHFDSNIAIRTIEIKDGVARCAGGAGITIDSDAGSEYQETLDKISPLLDSLRDAIS